MYLHFLDWVLPFITKLNIEFQSEQPKVFLLYSRMEETYRAILGCYMKSDYLQTTAVEKIQFRNPSNFVALEEVNLGARCNAILSKVDFKMAEGNLKTFRINCLNMYVELAHELYQRFTFGSEHCQFLKYTNFIVPQNIQTIQSIAPAGSIVEKILDLDLNALDREWLSLKSNPSI